MRQRRVHLRSAVGYVPSDPELAWLYGNADPPPRSRAWLGAFDARGRILVSTQSRLLRSAPTPGAAEWPVRCGAWPSGAPESITPCSCTPSPRQALHDTRP
jgi:hypothetical protein